MWPYSSKTPYTPPPEPVVEMCNGLGQFMENPIALGRVRRASENGNIFAYGDVGIVFSISDDAKDTFQAQMKLFNRGDVHALDDSGWHCYKVGSSLESVTNGGAKSGGRTLEIDSSGRVVAMYDQHSQRMPL